MLTDTEFGKRLSKERKRLGMNQTQFSDACGVKVASQFLYEKGVRSPNSSYLIKAKSLGVQISYLFGGDRSPSIISANLTKEELVQIFIACDIQSRTHDGKSLDLEYKIDNYKSLIDKYIDRKNLDKDQAA